MTRCCSSLKPVAVATLATMTWVAADCGFQLAQAGNESVTAACVAGSYLIIEGSGTRSLWTLFEDGNFIGTSSAQSALSFSTQHGSWEVIDGNEIQLTHFDFSFDEQGALSNLARLDAALTIDNTCRQLDGSFTLRFFDEGEDPSVPASDSGDPILDSIAGQQIGGSEDSTRRAGGLRKPSPEKGR